MIAEGKDTGEPPPPWIAPLHLHRKDDEACYVPEGAVGVRIGKDVVEAQTPTAGDGAHVLESGARTGALSHRDDVECVLAHSGQALR